MKWNIYLWVILFLSTILLGTYNCTNDDLGPRPEGLTADFDQTCTLGCMVPCEVSLTSAYQNGDTYLWEVAGITSPNPNITLFFDTNAVGTFSVKLTVTKDGFTETSQSDVTTGHSPQEGVAATVVLGNGNVNTYVMNNEEADFITIDQIPEEELNGLALDVEEGKLYYSGSVRRSNPNGTAKELVYTDNTIVEEVTAIALDFITEEKVYFVDNEFQYDDVFQPTIKRVNKDGSGLGIPIVEPFGAPRVINMDIDPIDNIAYFNNVDGFEIVAENPDNNDREFLFGNDPYERKYALAVNRQTQMLYFAEGGIGKVDIFSYDPLTETYEIVVDNASQIPILGIDIDEKAGFLYWTDSFDETLKRTPLAGGGIETVLTGVADPRGLVIGNFDE